MSESVTASEVSGNDTKERAGVETLLIFRCLDNRGTFCVGFIVLIVCSMVSLRFPKSISGTGGGVRAMFSKSSNMSIMFSVWSFIIDFMFLSKISASSIIRSNSVCFVILGINPLAEGGCVPGRILRPLGLVSFCGLCRCVDPCGIFFTNESWQPAYPQSSLWFLSR